MQISLLKNTVPLGDACFCKKKKKRIKERLDSCLHRWMVSLEKYSEILKLRKLLVLHRLDQKRKLIVQLRLISGFILCVQTDYFHRDYLSLQK